MHKGRHVRVCLIQDMDYPDWPESFPPSMSRRAYLVWNDSVSWGPTLLRSLREAKDFVDILEWRSGE